MVITTNSWIPLRFFKPNPYFESSVPAKADPSFQLGGQVALSLLRWINSTGTMLGDEILY